MEVRSAEQFRAYLKKEFKGALRGVAEYRDIDAYFVPKVERERDDGVELTLYFNPYQNLELLVIEYEEVEDGIVVTTPRGKWAFRYLDDADRKEYLTGSRVKGD